MKIVLVEFIPIILLFLLVSYTDYFIRISHTILGRLLAVTIILFYASFDIMHGVLACGLIILFYQSDAVDNILNLQYDEGFEPDDRDSGLSENASLNESCKKSYVDQYEEPVKYIPLSEDVKHEFRKTYCEKGHLVNKGQMVRTDMVEHVYPGVSFPGEKCNLCDPTCNFSIIERQLNTLLSENFVPKSGRNH
jgi:hypothetical protein